MLRYRWGKIWGEIKSFAGALWGELTGKPSMTAVLVVTGEFGGYIQYEWVGFKAGLFGGRYADIDTMLLFEPRMRWLKPRLDELARWKINPPSCT